MVFYNLNGTSINLDKFIGGRVHHAGPNNYVVVVECERFLINKTIRSNRFVLEMDANFALTELIMATNKAHANREAQLNKTVQLTVAS